MGCPISTQVNPYGDQYGDRNAWQSVRSRKDIKLPLSERDVFAVTKAWKKISKNMTKTGIAMFLKMFDTSAEVRYMFEQFRTVDNVADLYTSRALENHALLVMNALDEAITNLDDEEYLIEYLLVTGKSHQRFENFGSHIFWAIEEPFLSAVKQTLGDRCTPNMQNLYRKAIRFILNTLIVGYKTGADFIGQGHANGI